MRRLLLPFALVGFVGLPDLASAWDRVTCGTLAEALLTHSTLGETHKVSFGAVEAQPGGCLFEDVAVTPITVEDADPRMELGLSQAVFARRLQLSGDALDWIVDPRHVPRDFAVSVSDLHFQMRVGPADYRYYQSVIARDHAVSFALEAGWNEETQTVEIDLRELVFPFGDRVSLSLLAEAVDLSSREARARSLGSFRITRTTFDAQLFTLFQRVVLLPLLTALEPPPSGSETEDLPETPSYERVEDVERRFEDWKDEIGQMVADMPESLLYDGSELALQGLIEDLPRPQGRLKVDLTSQEGIGPAQVILLTMNSSPDLPSLELLRPILDRLSIEASWEPVPQQ